MGFRGVLARGDTGRRRLGEIGLGEKARPGAPAVAALFNDPQRWMREAVTNAMRRIGGME
jgi:hypothetical protein